MSRSYKKNPHLGIVCMRPETRSSCKRLVNRDFRRRLNRGDFDDEIGGITLHKKKEDISWNFDIFTLYHNPNVYSEKDWFKKSMRK